MNGNYKKLGDISPFFYFLKGSVIWSTSLQILFLIQNGSCKQGLQPFFIFFSLRTRKSSCFSPCGDYSLYYAPYIFNLINVLPFYRSMVWNYALNHILKNQQSQAFRFLKNFSPLIPKIFLKRLAYFYFAMILSCCPHRKFERIKKYRTLTIK